jgi:hypothetical protein
MNSVTTVGMPGAPRAAAQSTLVAALKATLDVIVKCVNESGVLVGWCLNAYLVIQPPPHSILSILYLRKYPEENNAILTPDSVGKGFLWRPQYAKAALEWQDRVTSGRTASGAGIDSSIGQDSGSFLFALQLLLIETVGTVRFDLRNYTDDKSRAARGIYSQLRFAGKGGAADLGAWASDAQGDMYWTRSSRPSSGGKQDALYHLYAQIQKARGKAAGASTSIWSASGTPVEALRDCLGKNLPQYAVRGGRRRQRKYTKRNRHRRRKTKRRRTRC